MPNKPSERDLEQLSAYLDGMLTAPERIAFEERLAEDTQLQAELEGMRETIALLRRAPRFKAPRNFTLDAAAVAAPQHAWWKRITNPGVVMQFSGALGTAAALILITLAIIGPNQTPDTASDSIQPQTTAVGMASEEEEPASSPIRTAQAATPMMPAPEILQQGQEEPQPLTADGIVQNNASGPTGTALKEGIDDETPTENLFGADIQQDAPSAPLPEDTGSGIGAFSAETAASGDGNPPPGGAPPESAAAGVFSASPAPHGTTIVIPPTATVTTMLDEAQSAREEPESDDSAPAEESEAILIVPDTPAVPTQTNTPLPTPTDTAAPPPLDTQTSETESVNIERGAIGMILLLGSVGLFIVGRKRARRS